MRVSVDIELCQGHGVCASEAPEIFEIGEDGRVTVLIAEPPSELNAELANAVRYCPTGTISTSE